MENSNTINQAPSSSLPQGGAGGGLIVHYSCAVLLIISSIVMVFIELFRIDDVPDGLIFYIAQAFLLAGSIFGLDYYIKQLTSHNVSDT